MLDAKGWEERKTQLGASDMHKIFNFDNKGAKDLWLEKIGELERKQFSNKYTVAGSLIEDDALEFYFKSKGITNYSLNKRMKHPDIEMLVASCDAIYILDDVKLTFREKIIPVENKTIKYDNFIELKADKIPRNYYLQVQTQIACCGGGFGVIVFNAVVDKDYIDPLLYKPNYIKQIAFNIKKDDAIVNEIVNRAKYFEWCVKYKREPSESDYQARSVF